LLATAQEASNTGVYSYDKVAQAKAALDGVISTHFGAEVVPLSDIFLETTEAESSLPGALVLSQILANATPVSTTFKSELNQLIAQYWTALNQLISSIQNTADFGANLTAALQAGNYASASQIIRQSVFNPIYDLWKVYDLEATTLDESFAATWSSASVVDQLAYEKNQVIFLPLPDDMASLFHWESDNTDVATVDASGNVTIKGRGTAKITATAAMDAYFFAPDPTITFTYQLQTVYSVWQWICYIFFFGWTGWL
jgi:hypothetical protein